MSFEPLRDAEPFTDNEPMAVAGRALASWLFCTVAGGLALTGAISVISEYFGAPAFAEMDYLGFVLGAVLAVPIAAVIAINALRDG